MIVGIALRFFWETIEWLLFPTITKPTEFFLASFPPPNQDGKRLYYFWSPKYRTFSWCMVILLGRLFTSSWECPWSRVWPVWEYSACSTPSAVVDPSKALLLHHRTCWKSEELCPSCLSLCVWSSCQPRIIVESLCLVPYDLIKTQPLSFSNQPSKWLQFRLFLHLTKAYQSIHFSITTISSVSFPFQPLIDIASFLQFDYSISCNHQHFTFWNWPFLKNEFFSFFSYSQWKIWKIQ